MIFVTFIFTLPKGGLQGDLNYWIRWIQWIRDLGLSNVYAISEVNYFPVYLYILYLFNWLIRDMTVIAANIYLIKIFIWSFDIGSILLTGFLLKRLKMSPFLSFFILFNLAFFFNSLLWGQIESLYIFFVLASFLAAWAKHPLLSITMYILAFYSKLQAIIFLPAVCLLLLPVFLQHKHRKKIILQAVASFVITQFILLLPFVVSGNIGLMFQNVLQSVDMFPVLSNNAFNFWILIFGGNNMYVADSTVVIAFSYKTWGILLFCLSSIIIFLPYLFLLVKKSAGKIFDEKLYISQFFLVNGLISLVFFFFNTQMHERYLQPSILFLGIAAVLRPKKLMFILYALVSVAFILNLERVIKYFGYADYDSIIFSSRIVAFLFFLAILLGIYCLYEKLDLKENLLYVKNRIKLLISLIGKFNKEKQK